MKNLDFQLYRLSQQFYIDYPRYQFPEILRKQERPYNCFVLELNSHLFICIPYRSNISHQNAYLFKNSIRSRKNKSGLDYSKLVVVDKSYYLDDKPVPLVDQDEYKETVQNIKHITTDVIMYIVGFLNHHNGYCRLHQKDYERRYGYSTLPYFQQFLQHIQF